MHDHVKITGRYPLDSNSWIQSLLGKLRTLIGGPFIYGLLIPLIMADIFLEIHHRVCFTIFGIPKIKRSDYFIFDRHRLPYLNLFEKLNCLYCSYFNNFLAYAQEIAARTERHWCPIKHALKRRLKHEHYEKFFDYGDADRYQREKKLIRIYREEEQ